MSERTKKLRRSLLETNPKICSERAKIFTESMKKSEGLPIAKRRAEAFYNVLNEMTIYIREGELIVGNQASTPRAAPIFPEYSVDWIEKEFKGDPHYFYERPTDVFEYDEKTKKELLNIIEYWKDKTVYDIVRKLLPKEANSAWNMGVIDEGWVSEAGFGNIIPDYEFLLKQGLEGVINKAEIEMKNLDLKEPEEIKKYWFLESLIRTNQAVINFSKRFADELTKLAKIEKNVQRKSELEEMAKNCKRVPEKPATSFWEAVQSVWFVHLAIQIESNGHSISFGRFDQYLFPYYQNDIENGKITKEEATEIIESFFIKCNEINKLRPWEGTKFFPGYHLAENLAIGGQTKDGKDAVNELTYIILNVTENMKLPKPSVSIKWFEGTSKEFMNRAIEVVYKHGGGQPAFYNDLGVMRMLKNMGVKNEDLYNWAPDGCIEASIPGKWDFAAKGPWLNVAKVFELAINNGRDPSTGIVLHSGKGCLEDFEDVYEIFDAFLDQLRYFMELQVITENINDEVHKLHDINAFRSSLIEDCIGRGKSLIEGGSIYSADGGPTVGIITVADSLSAIESAVFEKELIKIKDLKFALETNFENQETSPSGEEIRQILLNKTPKFGNDDDRADKWAVKIMDFMGSSYAHDFKNSRYGKGPIPGKWALSQSSVSGNVAFGRFVGATPDGRRKGEPLNNGVSPTNGAEKNGPVAAINSVSKLPSIWFQKGAIFNMRLVPELFKSENGRIRIAALIETLFKNYQYHIQFNVVDNETLRDAQKNPERYKDLLVRVAGYSAFFTSLSKELQEDIINRVQMNI